jgi:hypothetical protein
MRATFNFYIPGEREMKLIEGGVTWFNDVLKAKDKYGLENWLFEVERHGSSGDPKTSYTILPEEKLTADQSKEIEGMRLHDLPKAVAGRGDKPASADKRSGETIDVRQASELVARLKALPRDAVDSFLSKFAVQRVRDLKRSDEKAAAAFLAAVEGRYTGQTTQANDEVDPFA